LQFDVFPQVRQCGGRPAIVELRSRDCRGFARVIHIEFSKSQPFFGVGRERSLRRRLMTGRARLGPDFAYRDPRRQVEADGLLPLQRAACPPAGCQCLGRPQCRQRNRFLRSAIKQPISAAVTRAGSYPFFGMRFSASHCYAFGGIGRRRSNHLKRRCRNPTH
jgi:hypothetical protein